MDPVFDDDPAAQEPTELERRLHVRFALVADPHGLFHPASPNTDGLYDLDVQREVLGNVR